MNEPQLKEISPPRYKCKHCQNFLKLKSESQQQGVVFMPKTILVYECPHCGAKFEEVKQSVR